MEEEESEAKKKAEEALRKEWDLLKTSGLLSQIGCSAGPERIGRGPNKKPIYNMFKWKALMTGPKKSPYSGYLFEFEITYPYNYPEKPPNVNCKTNIYHMNVSTSGNVCVASTKERPQYISENEKKNYWTEAGDISTVLLSIFCILAKPNPRDPYRSDLAELYDKNPEEYEKNAKEHCQKNAKKIY